MRNIAFLVMILFVSLLIFPLSSFSQQEEEISKEKKEFNPKPASASVYNLGLKSYEQGDLDSAISFFKRAVELDPEFVDAYFNLGAIYKKQGNMPLAINAFQKAVDFNSADVEAAYELATCYVQGKNYSQAKKYFSLIPQDFPKYKEAKRNLDLIANIQTTEPKDQVTIQPQNHQISEPQDISTSQAQLLVDTLTKPGKETFKESFKVITGNLHGPTGIAKDSNGNLYIANFTKDAIERITPDGKREVFIEKIGLNGPVGLAVDENDNLFVANYSGDSIIKVAPTKEVIVLINKIVKPYYLFYDNGTRKLFATVQGNDSLVEIDTSSSSKQPITSR